MPKAIFVTEWQDGQPHLLPLQDDGSGGPYLCHAEGDGFCVMSPAHDPTCLVMVRTDEDTLNELAALPYCAFVEEIADAKETEAAKEHE